jgi:FeS assembly protein SufD
MNDIIIKKNEKKELKFDIDKNEDFNILVEKNAELNLMVIYSLNKLDSKINFNINLEENSKLNFINLQKFSNMTENNILREIKQERNSVFNLFDLNFGGKLTNVNVSANLNGENSRFEHFAVFLGNKEQRFNFDVNAFHNAPYTYSNMLTKGALSDKSKSFYKGLIKIKQNASNSNGYQKQDAILLSQDAESNSIPKLEIDNNEVRCTHGSSVSQIDDEKMFYVMSRGLDEKEAKITLVKGFLREVIDKVNFGELDELIEENIK